MSEEENEFWKPKKHSMKRRSMAHDYSRGGYYHITISVNSTMYQPLGRIVGQLDKPDGDCNAPHVELTPIGQLVEQELCESIHHYYPMLDVLEYVIMPEHLHFLLIARDNVVSKNGKATHLGHVIAGFKLGCNKRYWKLVGLIDDVGYGGGLRNDLTTESSGTVDDVMEKSVFGDSVAPKLLPPLFEAGYCDVMPVDAEQLETQRAYIRNNPRSRLLRKTYHTQLYPQRKTIDTAVSMKALHGYLNRECRKIINEGEFGELESRLLIENRHIMCDSFGPIELLNRRLLPVVCHRMDNARFKEQSTRCMAEAKDGAVLVSARISRSEQEIMDCVLQAGYPIIRIEDNGFPEIFHPSASRMDCCANGKLLLVTPWSYRFRSHDENITNLMCKTMNCVAQAICQKRDDWWKVGTTAP